MDFLTHALDFIQNHVAASAGTFAIVFEIASRMLPTEKPMSVLHAVSDFLKLAGKVCQAAGDAMDKILPQKLKP